MPTADRVRPLDEPPALLPDEGAELAVLSAHLGAQADEVGVGPDRPLQVVEAGCGRRWRIDVGDRPLEITGVDLDPDAVAIRQATEGDLHRAVVGDLRTVDLPEGGFDAVSSSFVLEHVAGAEQVLDRFVRWTRPGGLLLLRIPDRDSVYGWATRRTPHRVHVAFRRHVIGMPGAGTAGHGPYPTVYDDVVSRRGLRAWARWRGVTVEAEHGSSVYLARAGALGPPLRVGVAAVAASSRHRLAGDHNNLLYVLRTPA